MAEEDVVRTQSMLQNANDDDMTPTKHEAKAQRLGQRPTRMDTVEQTGEPGASSRCDGLSCERNERGGHRRADSDDCVADFKLEFQLSRRTTPWKAS